MSGRFFCWYNYFMKKLQIIDGLIALIAAVSCYYLIPESEEVVIPLLLFLIVHTTYATGVVKRLRFSKISFWLTVFYIISFLPAWFLANMLLNAKNASGMDDLIVYIYYILAGMFVAFVAAVGFVQDLIFTIKQKKTLK